MFYIKKNGFKIFKQFLGIIIRNIVLFINIVQCLLFIQAQSKRSNDIILMNEKLLDYQVVNLMYTV